MTTLIYDTHKIFKRLTAAGLSAEHAEAITESLNDNDAQLMTRADAAELKAELIKWTVTVGIVQTTTLAAVAVALVLKFAH